MEEGDELGEKMVITIKLTKNQRKKIVKFAQSEDYRLPLAYGIIMAAGIEQLGL